jgi:hypothetical protein
LYNVPTLLNKEVDPSKSKIATNIGSNPATEQSINLAIICQNLDSTPATFQYSYMITIDAVVELTDMIED